MDDPLEKNVATPYAWNDDGRTPLHEACLSSSHSIVELLLAGNLILALLIFHFF